MSFNIVVRSDQLQLLDFAMLSCHDGDSVALGGRGDKEASWPP